MLEGWTRTKADKGTVVMFLCTKCTVFAYGQHFLFRPRIFSRAVGCGARRGGACTLHANLGVGQVRGARSGK